MKGSFSEESLARFAELAAATLPSDFAEGDSYDFTTCIRPDGSAYGTSGKCRKGTEGVAKVKAKGAASGVPVLTKGDMKKMTESELRDVKKKMDEQAFGKDSGPASNTKLQMLADQNKAINEELKSRGAAPKPASGGRGSRGPVDRDARVAKHQEKYDAAKAAHDASKAALAAHKGRDARSRALKQPLQSKHEANIEKLGAARDRLIDAKVAANAAKAKVESKK